MTQAIHRVGVDLGGSKILAVVCDADGRVLAEAKKRTKPERGYAAVVERVAGVIRAAIANAEVAEEALVTTWGVGVPGPVSGDGRTVMGATNLGWPVVAMADDLEAFFPGRRFVLGNDVNVGALGEVHYGCARAEPSVFALFVGTGLGGALVLDGRVVTGRRGLAGEVGHLPAPFGARLCSCGQHGCLETVASKVGIRLALAEARAQGVRCLISESDKMLRAGALRTAYDEGCQATRRAVKHMGRALAWAVVAVTAVAEPSCCVIGGGVGEKFGSELLAGMRKALARYPYFGVATDFDIRLAALGDHAVAIGAIRLAEDAT